MPFNLKRQDPKAAPGVCPMARTSASLSAPVSTRSSRSAPMMPLRAA